MKKADKTENLWDLERRRDSVIQYTCGLLALLTSSLEHKNGNGLSNFSANDSQCVALLCQHLEQELSGVQRSIEELEDKVRLKAGGKPI